MMTNPISMIFVDFKKVHIPDNVVDPDLLVFLLSKS